jgi:hypothetical protein
MSIQQWAGLIVSILTIGAAFATLVRWLVKHYLYELKPNGGTSIKDQVNRLEEKVDNLYNILIKQHFEDR